MRSLAGARAKVDRANEHIDSLRSQLQAAMDSGDHRLDTSLRHETYGGHAALTQRVTDMPVFSLDTSILIGEVVHHLRSALDHLAWALVPPARHRRLNERQARQVAFPMARSRKKFWDGANHQLPGVARDDRQVIERYQPYRRSTTGRTMRALATLSNTDKHRTIVPALFYPLDYHVDLTFKGAKQRELIKRLERGQQMKLGIELVTWTVTRKPTDVTLKAEISSSPAFHPTLVRPPPGHDLVDVTGTLRTAANTCAEILSHFDD